MIKDLLEQVVAISSLFHDIGKINDQFQSKLHTNLNRIDKYRHEYVSCKIIEVLYSLYGTEWINNIINDKADYKKVILILKKQEKNEEIDKINISEYPYHIQLICYLILVHHQLPIFATDKENKYSNREFLSFSDFFSKINTVENIKNYKQNDVRNTKDCFSFKNSISFSNKNKEVLDKYYSALLSNESLIKDMISSNSEFQLFIRLARLSLMLADYKVSSEDEDKLVSYNKSMCFANKSSCRNNRFKQTVDEHINRVSNDSVSFLQNLSTLVSNFSTTRNDNLDKKSPSKYDWQNKISDKIKAYKKDYNNNSIFFCVNMASTGTGKTIANAKIINAMNNNEKGLRYILAVGLRTLVLQTGTTYMESPISFPKESVSVCIGSSAVEQLYADEKNDSHTELLDIETGYEKEINSIMPSNLNPFNDSYLQVLFNRNSKYESFLEKPVLVCTIDYMMRVTQTVKGGKYMLPFLRLLSSDLVIDEIDDFNIQDLNAITQLIYVAGMCGRNVIISSATLTEDVSLALQYAHLKGLCVYNSYQKVSDINYKNKEQVIALCDEYDSSIYNNASKDNRDDIVVYYKGFINNRISMLKNDFVKRKGEILPVNLSDSNSYFNVIEETAYKYHDNNHIIDKKTGKRVSIGIIRMANIKPCVEIFKRTLNYNRDDYSVYSSCYHSRQLLFMRHQQELYFKKVLNRKYTDKIVDITDKEMRNKIDNSSSNNILFLVIATPVIEVGCDYDFDWCITDVSSMHSLVQLVGRVLRHRSLHDDIHNPNIGILQYNYAEIMHTYFDSKCFINPGVENDKRINLMNSHDISNLFDADFINSIDSSARINKPSNDFLNINKLNQLNYAELYLYSKFNDFKSKGASNFSGYMNEFWYLTSLPQSLNSFRNSSQELVDLCFIPNNSFFEKILVIDLKNEKDEDVSMFYDIKIDDAINLKDKDKIWFYRNLKDTMINYFEKQESVFTSDNNASDRFSNLIKWCKKYSIITAPDNKKTKYYNNNCGIS